MRKPVSQLQLVRLMMNLRKIKYFSWTLLYALLALLFFFIAVESFRQNVVVMCGNGLGLVWDKPGTYVGLFTGIIVYLLYIMLITILRRRHNLHWFMLFTHELTHTFVALSFFRKIREFIVTERECYVTYDSGRIGYVPITLSPYCIPIYTLMLFPFRFIGDGTYMIVFDFLIAFTYSFHVHSFIKQTRFSQPDIENCGKARSVAFISLIHFVILAIVFAIPKGGIKNTLGRVFWEYPMDILSDFFNWIQSLI